MQDLYAEFSKSITEYDKENDVDERKNLLEKITELHDKIVEELDTLGGDVGENYNDLKDVLASRYKYLDEKYDDVQGKGYFNYGEREGKKEREEIKTLFELSNENLTNTTLKNRAVDKLDALNDYIAKFESNFGKKGVLVDLHSKLENRAKEIPFKTPFSTPSKTPKKGKTGDFSPMPLPLDPEDKKEIEKMIENPEMKAQIIDKIMKAFPSFKKEQLDSLSVKDLLEISITLGFDFSNFGKLRAPENATKEVKELAQNLENLKREREIQEEFNRLKNKIQGEEAITAKEKKEKILKRAGKIIKENLPKEEAFKLKTPKKTEAEKSQILKSETIARKHIKDLLNAGNISLEENFADIQNTDFLSLKIRKRKKKNQEK
eukprot:gene763-9014_t